MSDIVVEIRGGLVVEVYSEVPDARLVVVDWDKISDGGSPFCWGGYPPLCRLPEGTRVQYEEAIRCEKLDQAGRRAATQKQ